MSLAGAALACARRLLQEDEWRSALPDALEVIGAAGGTDGAVLLTLQPPGAPRRVSALACWTRSQASTRSTGGMADTTLDAVLPTPWQEKLAVGEAVDGPLERAPLTGQPGRAAAIAAPIHVQGVWWGALLLWSTGSGRPTRADPIAEAIAVVAACIEQRISAETLAEREAQFRSLTENVADILFRYRFLPEPGLDYVSPSVEAVTGYPPEALYDNPDLLIETVPAQDQAQLQAQLREQEYARPLALQFRHRDGHPIWLEHRLSPIYDEAGRLAAVEGITRDITERKHTEEALGQRAAEQQYIAELGSFALEGHDLEAIMQRCVELAADAFRAPLAKVVTAAPGGTMQVAAAVGWGEGTATPPVGPGTHAGHALLSNTAVLFRGPQADDECPGAALLMVQGIRSGIAVPVSGPDRTHGALAVHSREPGRFEDKDVVFCQALANVLADAVERDETSRELARREREFRLLAEHSPDVIARFDDALRFVYVNPVVHQKTGFTPEQLIGRTVAQWEQLTDGTDAWRDALTEALATGRGATFEFELATPGGPGIFEAKVIPETGSDGEVESVLAIARDVTERHRSEQQLLETVERLQRIDEERRRVLDRLVGAQEQERQRIAADIHDDSIQVMVAASLRLEALAAHVTSAEGQEILEKLSRTVQRAITRLRRLMFELRPPQLDRDGLAPAIRTALETSWEEGDGPTREVINRLHDEPPPELRAILYRIAQEAIANIRRHAQATSVSVLLEDVDTGYRMRVQDDGKGFDVYRAGQAVPGHIGVMSMRERAELAGGWLALESAPGAGTTVEVWVPSASPLRKERPSW